MIFGLFSKPDSTAQREQLEAFLKLLEQCQPQDLGLTVALVEHFANSYATLGRDFYDPSEVMASRPDTLPWAIGEVQRLQASELAVVASGWMIWIHTFRAVVFPELMPLGKRMWKHLSEGFPYAQNQVGTLEPMLGFIQQVENPNRFPLGFEPDQVSKGTI